MEKYIYGSGKLGIFSSTLWPPGRYYYAFQQCFHCIVFCTIHNVVIISQTQR